MIDKIRAAALESIETKRRFFETNADSVALAARMIIASLTSNGKLLAFGNGGSAADAQHIVAELVNRLARDHPPIAAVALTTDTSIMTSVANDLGFEQLFERQLRGKARTPEDRTKALRELAGIKE